MAKLMQSLPAGFNAGPLDLDQPLDNQVALLKLQADLSGADRMGAFGGYAWAWIPGEQNRMLFGTYGLGCSRIEYHEEEGGWRFYHREVLYYTDLKTGEVLDSWHNPLTGQEVEVLHIRNDPVHRFYPIKGGPFAPPYPYTVNGDNLVFQMDVFRAAENPMKRAEYPLHSQQDVYQSAELWAIQGRLSEINDPGYTAVDCHTAWARLSMWLPFMEMGNRPGHMVYHSQSFTLANGVDDLKPQIRKYVEANDAEYLTAPTEWDLSKNENTWTYSKKEIDRRREAGAGNGESVFGVVKS